MFTEWSKQNNLIVLSIVYAIVKVCPNLLRMVMTSIFMSSNWASSRRGHFAAAPEVAGTTINWLGFVHSCEEKKNLMMRGVASYLHMFPKTFTFISCVVFSRPPAHRDVCTKCTHGWVLTWSSWAVLRCQVYRRPGRESGVCILSC